MSAPCCGTVMPGGGAPPDCPCVHTPSNRATVPHGQVSAEAGAATAIDPMAAAKVQQASRIRRFTVPTLACRDTAARAMQICARLNDPLAHRGLGLLQVAARVVELLVAHL